MLFLFRVFRTASKLTPFRARNGSHGTAAKTRARGNPPPSLHTPTDPFFGAAVAGAAVAAPSPAPAPEGSALRACAKPQITAKSRQEGTLQTPVWCLAHIPDKEE